MKARHTYRLTLEALDEAPGLPAANAPATLRISSHDDLFAIIERAQARAELPPADAQLFALGLKLLGEVMLQHRDLALFRAFRPHFAEFMKTIKSGATPAA